MYSTSVNICSTTANRDCMLWTGMLRREEHDSSCVIRHFTKRDDVSRLQAAALLSEHGLTSVSPVALILNALHFANSYTY